MAKTIVLCGVCPLCGFLVVHRWCKELWLDVEALPLADEALSHSINTGQILDSIVVVGSLFSFLYVPSLSMFSIFSTYSFLSIATVALPLSAGRVHYNGVILVEIPCYSV